MNSIDCLIEVLKSQVSLYGRFYNILLEEKEFAVSWQTAPLNDLIKDKELLMKKERVQEAARAELLAKISSQYSDHELTLSELLPLIDDANKRERIEELGITLLELITKIQAENYALKMVYATNRSLLNGFFEAVNGSGTYDSSGKMVKKTSIKKMMG